MLSSSSAGGLEIIRLLLCCSEFVENYEKQHKNNKPNNKNTTHAHTHTHTKHSPEESHENTARTPFSFHLAQGVSERGSPDWALFGELRQETVAIVRGRPVKSQHALRKDPSESRLRRIRKLRISDSELLGNSPRT